MDLITSVFTICGTVTESDRQYKILAKKLTYELKKAQHLMQTQKVKNVPQFMFQNLKHKIHEAKEHLRKIQNILTEDGISFAQKIKLALPFNKTNAMVKTALEQLQKAQQDVTQYGGSSESENNGKRSWDDFQKMQKKQDLITMDVLIPQQEINDEDIDDAIMGPTLQEDAAIQFTKNKYFTIKIQLQGDKKIIEAIQKSDKRLLTHQKKVIMNFVDEQGKDLEQIQVFSLGRLYFKDIYTKLKPSFADIDKISKEKHFTIVLRRLKQFIKKSELGDEEVQKSQIKKSAHKLSQKAEDDMFFSFPVTAEQMVIKQMDSVILKRQKDKNIYFNDMTGAWQKMNELQQQICKGELISPIIPLANKEPSLYFKIHFEID